MAALIELSDTDSFNGDELVDLYDSVGWSAYTDQPDHLELAIASSGYVLTARVDGLLVGLLRGLTDGVSIFYLQDLLVHPDYQENGIGSNLMKECLHKHADIRQMMLLTDDTSHVHDFYRKFGFTELPAGSPPRLYGFAKVKGFK